VLWGDQGASVRHAVDLQNLIRRRGCLGAQHYQTRALQNDLQPRVAAALASSVVPICRRLLLRAEDAGALDDFFEVSEVAHAHAVDRADLLRCAKPVSEGAKRGGHCSKERGKEGGMKATVAPAQLTIKRPALN
jgi:hypothetical protein